MPVTALTVFAHLPGGVDAVPAGRLELQEQGGATLGSRFVYGKRYLERPNRLAVDPTSLGFEGSAALEGWRQPANGLSLFGAIRDATPDLWGRKVIENKLNAPPDGLPESTYLLQAGSNRLGALDVRRQPEDGPNRGALPGAIDLDHLVEAAECVEEGLPVPEHLQLLFDGAPTLGGARPKAVIQHEGRQWLAKFPASKDRFDVPAVERATLELARLAQMDVPATQLVALADGRNVMLIERFDRRRTEGGDERVHMVSGLTMLGKDESDVSGSYADLAGVISTLGAAGHVAEDRTELFRRMVFNILVGNDDDHLRNHAFLFDGSGWRLSPLYDVLPKPQLATDRNQVLGVGAAGRSATLSNAISQCERFGLSKASAAGVIEGVAAVAREWRVHFESFGCSVSLCDRVSTAFRRPRDIGLDDVGRMARR